MIKVLFLTIQFSHIKSSSHLFALSLNVKQFYLNHRTLSDATTSGQSRLGSYDIEGVLHILQISKAGASLSSSLMSCLEHLYSGHPFFVCKVYSQHILSPTNRAAIICGIKSFIILFGASIISVKKDRICYIKINTFA